MTPGPLIGSGATAEVFEWTDTSSGLPKALKLFKLGVPEEYIEQERQASRAVTETTLPVARFDGEIVDKAGRIGFVFERIQGPSLARWGEAWPWRVGAYARHLADLHLQVHSTTITGLISLKQMLRRNIPRTRSFSEVERSQLMEMIEALPDGNHLCHGDFHSQNVIYRKPENGGPAIIDWMGGSVGDPLADVARTRCLFTIGWTSQKNPAVRSIARVASGLLELLYTRRYFARSGADARGVEAWMPLIASGLIYDLEMLEEVGEQSCTSEIAYLVKLVRRRLSDTKSSAEGVPRLIQ